MRKLYDICYDMRYQYVEQKMLGEHKFINTELYYIPTIKNVQKETREWIALLSTQNMFLSSYNTLETVIVFGDIIINKIQLWIHKKYDTSVDNSKS